MTSAITSSAPSPATPTSFGADAASLRDVGATAASLRRFLHGLPGGRPGRRRAAGGGAGHPLDQEGVQAAPPIDLAISMVDLTTLEGADTAGKVRNLARKAMLPDPDHPDTPAAAAVCVYPDMVPVAVEALPAPASRSPSVATAFPAGRSSLEVKLADTRLAVDAGADEIDMVIDRGAFLAGRYGRGASTRSWRSRRPAARPGSR